MILIINYEVYYNNIIHKADDIPNNDLEQFPLIISACSKDKGAL